MTTPQSNTFKLDEFKFLNESGWNRRFGSAISRRMLSFFGMTPIWPPVIFKKRRGWKVTPTLSDLGAAIGFDDPVSLELFSLHQRRSIIRMIPLLSVYVPLSLLIIVALFLSLGLVNKIDRSFLLAPSSDNFIVTLLALLAILLMYAFVLALFGIAVKIASIVTDKHFADSLCVLTIVYLIVELNRDDTLTQPGRKREVMVRLNHLARNTVLLSLLYSSKNSNNQEWITKHFKNMESYIRERERWALAPRETTLADLRHDFYQLVGVFLSGNYGDFQWVAEEEVAQLPLTWKQRVTDGLPRLLGFIVPLILMAFFIWQRTYLQGLGISNNIVALILISWLLLALDAVLKLGIVASLVNLAKGIKELK